MLKNRLIKCLWFLTFMFISLLGQAQSKIIIGEVLDENDKPLSNVNITLINKNGAILAFSISDHTGHFEMDISSFEKNEILYLEVHYLGYKKERQLIADKQSKFNFRLKPDITQLDEVLIKDKPLVERSKDTLKFNVNKFAKEEDRSIGDVLNRMPGINIGVDGTIYYNNEKIDNLYIHGDDLMAGKYGLATRAIKKEDILSVDIIKNHQPIKVLKDKMLSDKTAINLVLKDEDSYKLSAQAKLGFGSPEQYDISLTPIMLNKRVKILNSIAANNSGTDYRVDFKELGNQNMLSNIKSEKVNFSLSQGTVTSPDLPTQDYYINNSASLNLNNIYTFTNNLQIRLNIQGLVDKNTISYNNELINYSINDTISFNEEQNVINRPKILNSSINLSKNEENYFFNNNFSLNFHDQANSSSLIFNDDSFSQRLSIYDFSIMNDFNWIPKINRKGIFEVRLLTEYNRRKNKLELSDGYQLPTPQTNEDYNNVKQTFELPTFYINGFVSYKLPMTDIKQDYSLGYVREDRIFKSSLSSVNSDEQLILGENYTNSLNWKKNRYYFTSELSFKNNKIRALINLPLFYQSINYFQEEYQLNETEARFYFNPSVNFQYAFNLEKRLDFNYSHETNFGDLSHIFRGIVLQNYRNLLSNSANLQTSNINLLSLKYNSENAAELLFFNVGLNYEYLKTNNVISYSIEDDVIESKVLPLENSQNRLYLDFGVSKYIFALKTKFSLKTQLSQSNFRNVINDELVPFQANNVSLSSNFSKSFFEIFSLDYNPKASWNFSKLEPINDNTASESTTFNTFRFEQNLNLTLSPNYKWNIIFNSNYISISQNDNSKNNFFLLNLNFRYDLRKKGFEFGLDMTNLFDVDKYRLYTISENQQNNSNFQLRGRMIIARLDWYF